jgi:ketol-acid reductoisomerase
VVTIHHDPITSTNASDTGTSLAGGGSGGTASALPEPVAVIGYGNLGRSLALNLRDSGLAVVVGNIPDDYREQAIDDGFEVRDPATAAAKAATVLVLLPDEVIPVVFARDLAGAFQPGAAVCFASGYAIAYGLVTPPAEVDVLLFAPRMLGEQVRRAYESGAGFWSCVSVEQDATGKARERLLALARAAGSLRRGAMELSAEQEATLDLFVEQTVGPILGAAFMTAFQVGVEAGLPPEALVLELYMSGELGRTMQAFADAGFLHSVQGHGLTAAFGGYRRSLLVDREAMERAFRDTVEDITSGAFARAFQEEQAAGYPTMAVIRSITRGDNPITEAEDRVRRSTRGTAAETCTEPPAEAGG